MTYCKFCNNQIVFDESHKSKTGKMIPLDFGNSEPHNCKARAVNLSCYGCGEKIFFDKSIKSESGKMIPQDVNGRGNHQCKLQGYR